MKEVAQPLIEESAKYGIGFTVMSIVIVACAIVIAVMWKHIIKQDDELKELMKDSIESNNNLANAINLLSKKQ